MKATHSQQLERWLGTDKVNHLSGAMKNWYGPPIPVQGVPGNVYVTKDGDFIGEIRAGYEATVMDRFESVFRRLKKNWNKVNYGQLNAGFSGLADLVAKSQAKTTIINYQKTGSTGVVGSSSTLWRNAGSPAAGGLPANAPAGTVSNSSTTGSPNFSNIATEGDTMHFITAVYQTNVISTTLLLYDRLYSVAKAMNSITSESVTGVPSRYQSTTIGDPDSAEGNFLFIETTAVLPATAHDWTGCTYKNQVGSTFTLPSVVGNASGILNRLDQPLHTWFCPLDNGDSGIKELMSIQCSAAVATGSIGFTIGHPIVFLPCPIANFICTLDGIASGLNLARILDNSCLAFLEVNKPSTSGTSYTGVITLVSG